MNAETRADDSVSRIAAAIGEPARARMLFCLMDDRARTSTELAVIAEVTPSTASVHLNRLKAERLVKVQAQGKHRYYRLGGIDVANALEGLSVLASVSYKAFVPHTPSRLLAARTCYDHIAGKLGVALHDRLVALGCLSPVRSPEDANAYELTAEGSKMFESLGADVDELQARRRRFAFGCLDWSERRSHLGGAAGAALLKLALQKNWVSRDLDTRALSVTRQGQRALERRFGIYI